MGVNLEEALFLENETFCEEVSDNLETEKKPLEFISSGNLEIDKKLEGGVPIGSLCLLEGAKGSGKSVFMGLKVTLILRGN
jgi:Predicted ATPases involved in biogenesis of archaeal flagella